jgi:hypothetical protein
VNLSALKSLIAANIQDTQLLLLINQLIDNQALDLDETVQIVDGLPPGPAHSYFFANIYLGMFDKFMEARTLKYFRYVDDFVFVCANEEELHRLNDELSRFINENIYARLSLRLSNAKTITKRVTNILPLLEHTRKLKYDLRFGVIEEISGESATNSVEDVQRNAEALFRDLFIRVEKEEDITRIAKESSGLIAKCLTELIVSKREARNIAYGLLELNPPRVTAIRALISSVIELSFDDEKALERFMEFIKEASDITKLTFLQILLGHREIPICVETLITDLLTSNNYLVRANAFLVMRSNEVPISLQKFREYRGYETSDYVLKHIINCLPLCDSHSQQPIWVEILAILDDCSSDVLIAILLVLDELIQINKISRDSFEIIFPAIHQHPHDSLFSDSIKLLLVSLYGNTSMIRAVWKSIKQYGESISHRIIQVISSNVIRHLSEQKKTSQLFLYSDTLAGLELSLQATVGYQELASRSPDPQLTAIARSKQSEIGASLGIPGLPSWYSLIDNDKGFFCGLSEEPHYRCRYFDDQAQEIKGTLEIISEEWLKPNESFASIDMWKNYLEHLNTNEVISLIECGVLPDSSFYALYEIPPGFMTIRDWLKNGQFLSGEASILKIASIT